MLIILGILTTLLVVAGPIWFMRLWSQLRRGRLYFFTTALRNCVRRNLPVVGAVQALLSDRVLRPNTLADVTVRLMNGVSLGQSLAACPAFFPPDYIALIELGERTGQLPTILDHLVADLAERRRRQLFLFSRLAYPFVILVVYMSVISFIMIRVIPKFRDIFAEFEVPLPAVTEAVIDASNVLVEYPLGPGLIFMVLLAILVYKLLGNLGVWHTWDVPRRLAGGVRRLVGATSRQELADLAASMSAALIGGATVVETLTLTARCTRPGRVRNAVLDALGPVKDGATLADALAATRIFPRTFLWMVRSGEAGGQLPEALRQVQVMYLLRARRLAHFLGTLVIPLITCFLAALVLVLALSVFSPQIGLLWHLSGDLWK